MSDIDRIANDIRNELGGTGLFGATTSGDLKNADSEFQNLDSQDANAVVSKLSDADLRNWADNANSSMPWDGLSAGEKRDLLNDMAGKLDGQQLARVAHAFGSNDVTDAVISHASPETRAQYVAAIAKDVNADPQFHAGFATATTTYGNDAAQSASKVLSSLDGSPSAFDAAARSLQNAGKLDDVIKVAAGRSDLTVSGGEMPSAPIVNYDSARLTHILNGAAQSSDLSVRTDVFRATTPALADMQQNTASLAGRNPSAESAADTTAKALSNVLTPEQAHAAGLVQNVPVAPPNASLQQNVAEAQQHGAIWVTKDQVPNKHPWDYKQQGAQYQDFGNFNYGVAEAAAGLPENVALRGAGWAQKNAGTSKPEWGNPTDLNGGPYGDDPADQAQIKAGYQYYNSGQWRLWSQ